MWIRLFAVTLLAVSAPATAQLQHFQTTLVLQEPVVNSMDVNTVIFRWSTFETSGQVSSFELEDLVMTVTTNGVARYTDIIIVDGVIQPFDGQPRIPEIGYFWDYNFATLTLEQMVSASDDLAMSSTGEHYVVNDSLSIPDDGVVDVRHFVDGATVDGASDFLDFQITELLTFSDGFESGDVSGWSLAIP